MRRYRALMSGWSKQGGFELYLMNGSKGTQLWNLVREAGRPWDIGPGNPNHCERVESGLLSFGGDTDEYTNPYEIRMGRYVDLEVPDEVVGIRVPGGLASPGEDDVIPFLVPDGPGGGTVRTPDPHTHEEVTGLKMQVEARAVGVLARLMAELDAGVGLVGALVLGEANVSMDSEEGSTVGSGIGTEIRTDFSEG